MHTEILEMLRCTCCNQNMRVEVANLEGNDIVAGNLHCQNGKVWSISEGVVDFGSEEQKNANNWSEELKNKTIEELDQEILEKTPANQLELQELTSQRVVQLVVREAPRFLLEVATGRGMFLKKLAPVMLSNSHIVCVDLSSTVLKAVHRKIKLMNPAAKIDCIACDASSLPFNDESFDMVTSFFGVSNMGASIPKGIMETRRILKQERQFLNASLIVGKDSKSYQLLLRYYGERAGSLVEFITLEGFQQIHNSCGFSDVEIDTIGESIAEKNELDPLPCEGDRIAFVVATARK